MTRNRKQTRGQSIVLMAFTAAFLAFTVLTTLAIGKAVRERVQLQNAADASAYSLAVQEARAFNFYAYTNRAIISHFVAMMSVYGHMSYLAYFEGVLWDLQEQWGCDTGSLYFLDSIPMQMTAIVAGWCADVVGGEVNCVGGGECLAQEWADNIDNYCNSITQELQNVDQQLGKGQNSGSCFSKLKDEAVLHRTVYANSLMLEQQAQDLMLQKAFLQQAMTKQIAQQFDPSYGVGVGGAAAAAVGALNVTGVPLDNNNAGYCTVGGPGIGSAGPVTSTSCSAVGGGGLTSLSTQQQAANASRLGPGLASGDWLNNRPDYGLTSPIQIYLVTQLGFHGYPETAILTRGTGMSREVVDPKQNGMPGTVNNGGNNQGGCQGTNCGSGGGGSTSFAGEDNGALASGDWACIQWGGVMGISYSGVTVPKLQTWAYSEPSGAQNDQSEIQWVDGSTTDTTAYDIGGCQGGSTQCGVGVATINYNPTSSSAGLFNEPHTWALVTKAFNDSDLKTAVNSQSYSSTQDEGPFAMSRSISLDGHNSYTYNNGITQQGGVPGREAMYAFAQGLAYYHRPGNWKEPPNFYNPYWRAKLHPVRMAAGGSNADAAADVGVVLKAGGYPTVQAGEMAAAVLSGAWPVTE